MARVKNPTVNKQTKEIKVATIQQSLGKMLIITHLNAAKLDASNASHSDVIDAHLFR